MDCSAMPIPVMGYPQNPNPNLNPNNNINHPRLASPPLRELLEPYSKEELVELIAQTAKTDVYFDQQWMNLLHHDTKWCKLFVYGLNYQTTNASLHEFYSQFGELKEAVVLMSKNGRSKGYGFVTFINRDGAVAASKLERHTIDGRMTHCCLAFAGHPKKLVEPTSSSPPGSPPWSGSDRSCMSSVRSDSSASSPMSPSPFGSGSGGSPRPPNDDPSRFDRRLFVRSLAWKTDDDTLRNAFAEYGEIEEAIVIRDRKTQKSKGFGFVVFAHAESANKALVEPEKTIDGRLTQCNLACARPANLPPPRNHHGNGQTFNQSPPPDMGTQMQSFQTQMMQGTTMGNVAFVPMMAPVNATTGGMVPLASFNNGIVQPYMMAGMAGNGSSVSSEEQSFSSFGQQQNVSPVLVPFQFPMVNTGVSQMGAVSNGGGPSQHKTKIIAVPAGNRSTMMHGISSEVRQPGGILPDSEGMHSRAFGSNDMMDAQSDRSSPITQGSRSAEP